MGRPTAEQKAAVAAKRNQSSQLNRFPTIQTPKRPASPSGISSSKQPTPKKQKTKDTAAPATTKSTTHKQQTKPRSSNKNPKSLTKPNSRGGQGLWHKTAQGITYQIWDPSMGLTGRQSLEYDGPFKPEYGDYLPVFEGFTNQDWWFKPVKEMIEDIPHMVRLNDFMVFWALKIFSEAERGKRFPADFDQEGHVRSSRYRFGKPVIIEYEGEHYYPVYGRSVVLSGEDDIAKPEKVNNKTAHSWSKTRDPFVLSFGAVRLIDEADPKEYPLVIKRHTANLADWEQAKKTKGQEDERSFTPPPTKDSPSIRRQEVSHRLRECYIAQLTQPPEESAKKAGAASMRRGRKRVQSVHASDSESEESEETVETDQDAISQERAVSHDPFIDMNFQATPGTSELLPAGFQQSLMEMSEREAKQSQVMTKASIGTLSTILEQQKSEQPILMYVNRLCQWSIGLQAAGEIASARAYLRDAKRVWQEIFEGEGLLGVDSIHVAEFLSKKYHPHLAIPDRWRRRSKKAVIPTDDDTEDSNDDNGEDDDDGGATGAPKTGEKLSGSAQSTKADAQSTAVSSERRPQGGGFDFLSNDRATSTTALASGSEIQIPASSSTQTPADNPTQTPAGSSTQPGANLLDFVNRGSYPLPTWTEGKAELVAYHEKEPNGNGILRLQSEEELYLSTRINKETRQFSIQDLDEAYAQHRIYTDKGCKHLWTKAKYLMELGQVNRQGTPGDGPERESLKQSSAQQSLPSPMSHQPLRSLPIPKGISGYPSPVHGEQTNPDEPSGMRTPYRMASGRWACAGWASHSCTLAFESRELAEQHLSHHISEESSRVTSAPKMSDGNRSKSAAEVVVANNLPTDDGGAAQEEASRRARGEASIDPKESVPGHNGKLIPKSQNHFPPTQDETDSSLSLSTAHWPCETVNCSECRKLPIQDEGGWIVRGQSLRAVDGPIDVTRYIQIPGWPAAYPRNILVEADDEGHYLKGSFESTWASGPWYDEIFEEEIQERVSPSEIERNDRIWEDSSIDQPHSAYGTQEAFAQPVPTPQTEEEADQAMLEKINKKFVEPKARPWPKDEVTGKAYRPIPTAQFEPIFELDGAAVEIIVPVEAYADEMLAIKRQPRQEKPLYVHAHCNEHDRTISQSSFWTQVYNGHFKKADGDDHEQWGQWAVIPYFSRRYLGVAREARKVTETRMGEIVGVLSRLVAGSSFYIMVLADAELRWSDENEKVQMQMGYFWDLSTDGSAWVPSMIWGIEDRENEKERQELLRKQGLFPVEGYSFPANVPEWAERKAEELPEIIDVITQTPRSRVTSRQERFASGSAEEHGKISASELRKSNARKAKQEAKEEIARTLQSSRKLKGAPKQPTNPLSPKTGVSDAVSKKKRKKASGQEKVTGKAKPEPKATKNLLPDLDSSE